MEKVHLYMKTSFSEKFHKFGFWILVAFALGGLAGNFYAEKIMKQRLSDSVTYKAIKIEGIEYDLKERP